jgi:hypothetical protein
VKQPLWQRRRRGQDESESDESRDAVDDPVADLPPPPEVVPSGPRTASDIRERLQTLRASTRPTPEDGDGQSAGAPAEPTAESDEREAAYAAWAERMRSHKKQKLAGIEPEQPEEEASAKPPLSPYWDSSTLFAPSEYERPDDPTLMETKELLAILEVSPEVTDDELTKAFRRLAKEHHPDRWHDADPAVRAAHEDRMALITEVHRELRRRRS